MQYSHAKENVRDNIIYAIFITAVNSQRVRIPSIFVCSFVLSTLIGCVLCACSDDNFVASQTRIAASNVTKSNDWYSFKSKISPFVSVNGWTTNDWYIDNNNMINDKYPIDIVAEVRAGFPFMAHSYVVLLKSDSSMCIVEGTGLRIGRRTIPACASMFYLMINIIVSFILLFLLICIFKTIIYLRRHSRELCIHCSYPALHNVGNCPECGNHIVLVSTRHSK